MKKENNKLEAVGNVSELSDLLDGKKEITDDEYRKMVAIATHKKMDADGVPTHHNGKKLGLMDRLRLDHKLFMDKKNS